MLRCLGDAIALLTRAGCARFFLDGSFVTAKEHPKDYEVLWDSTTVDVAQLDPVFLDFTHERAAQKHRFLGEFFPADATEVSTGKPFLEFFQTDKLTGEPKGIVEIMLDGTRDDKERAPVLRRQGTVGEVP